MPSGDGGAVPAGRSDEELLRLVHRRADSIRFRHRMGVASALVAVVALFALVPVLVKDDKPGPDDTASGPAGNYGSPDLRPGTTGPGVTRPGTGFIFTPTPTCRLRDVRPRGDEALELPGVVGDKEEDARSDLEAVGVLVWVQPSQSERAAGVVVDQAPHGGGYLETTGCWVTIVVSAGPGGPKPGGEIGTRS
jgi:hypothetical protein